MSIKSVKFDPVKTQSPDDTNTPHRYDGEQNPTIGNRDPRRAGPVAKRKRAVESKRDKHAVDGQKNGPLRRPRKIVNTVHVHADNFSLHIKGRF